MTQFERALQKIDLNLDNKQLSQFARFKELLVDANKKMNLTSIKAQDIELFHFIDSLLITRVTSLKKIGAVIDIGTGGGFPGIPLAIAFPHLEITLVDSTLRKIDFINYALTKLKLHNCIALHARAEELVTKEQYQESFDLGVSRALSDLPTIKALLKPFIKKDGAIISYKGQQREELNHNTDTLLKERLPLTEIERSFIVTVLNDSQHT